MSSYRVTVDTGGTFSDFVFLDEDDRRADDRQGALDARRSFARDPRRHRDAARARRARRRHRLLLPRHHGRHQRAARRQGRAAPACWSPRASAASIRSAEQCAAYGPAIFDVMYDKPALLVPQSLTGEVAERVDFRGQRAARARRGGAARSRARARGARHRIRRGVPAVLVPASAARGAGARDHRRGIARTADLAVLGGAAADPRVLPAVDHGHQRLPAADPRALHRPARRSASAAAGIGDAAAIRHAVERRHGDLRRRRRARGDDRAVRARPAASPPAPTPAA